MANVCNAVNVIIIKSVALNLYLGVILAEQSKSLKNLQPKSVFFVCFINKVMPD